MEPLPPNPPLIWTALSRLWADELPRKQKQQQTAVILQINQPALLVSLALFSEWILIFKNEMWLF